MITAFLTGLIAKYTTGRIRRLLFVLLDHWLKIFTVVVLFFAVIFIYAKISAYFDRKNAEQFNKAQEKIIEKSIEANIAANFAEQRKKQAENANNQVENVKQRPVNSFDNSLGNLRKKFCSDFPNDARCK